MGFIKNILNGFGLYTSKKYADARRSFRRLMAETDNLRNEEGEYDIQETFLPSGYGSVTIYRTFSSGYEEIGDVRIPVKTWWYDDEDERDLAINMAEETLEKLNEEV